MKNLLRLNFFAIGLPFALALLGIINVNLLIFAILSTMVTGGLQFLIALILLLVNPKNVHLYIYLALTILFFTLWMVFHIENWLFLVPVVLAVYLTYIVGQEYEKSKL